MALGTAFAEVDVSKLPPPAGRPVDFLKDIQPIFEASCLRCHGPEKPKSRFRLDDRALALKGGANGVAIIPGDSVNSPLIHFVARLDEDSAMPPEGKADPVTPEQVGLLRAWIDQGASWDGVRVSQMPKWEVSPTIRYFTVSGNEHRFEQHTGITPGWSGGLESFSLSQEIDANRSVSVTGHALGGVDDYAVELRYTHRQWGYVDAGVTQYDRFDNSLGGYYAGPPAFAFDLNRELAMEVGKAWFEAGLRRPDWPEITIAYEHHYRNGEKASTQWGPYSFERNGDFETRQILPTLRSLDESRHIIRVEAAHTIAGVRVEDQFRAEFYDIGSRRTQSFHYTPGATEPDWFGHLTDGHSQFTAANALRLEHQVRKWLLLSGGYLYSTLDGHALFQQELIGPPGSPFVPFNAPFTRSLLLDQHTHVFNANSQLGPWRDLTLGLGVQGEWMHQRGIGDVVLEDELPARLDANLRRQVFDETATARFTGIPFTVVFAEGRLQQEEVGQFEMNSGGGSYEFGRDTDAETRLGEAIGGFQVSPVTWGSFTAQYRHRDRDGEFRHLLDEAPPGTPGLGYSAFITGRDTQKDEFSFKLSLRPLRQLKVTLSYQLAAADYETRTAEIIDPFGGPSQPGRWLLTGNQDSQTVSLGFTLTPITRLLLNGNVSFQDSRVATPDNGLAALESYDGNVLTLLFHGSYQLDDKTQFRAGYAFSRADYGQGNAIDGLPLGLDYTWHRVTAGLSRRFHDNVTGSLQYAYHFYDEPSAGGFNDYRAHGIFATLTIHTK